jgi:hypothetical protein
MTAILPVNIHVTIGLLVCGNGVLIKQPIKFNSYPQLGGKFLWGSPNGRLVGGRSPNWDPLGGLPLNPPIGFYGWQAFDPRIYYATMVLISYIQSKPTSKLP